MTDSRISIIVPTLNEAGQIGSMLSKLQPLRERGHEVIVVDGGSRDKTISEAKPFADRVLDSPRGRGFPVSVWSEGIRPSCPVVCACGYLDSEKMQTI